MTADNTIPSPTPVQPEPTNPFLQQAQSELGVASGGRMAEDLTILEDDLRNLEKQVRDAAKKGLDTPAYRAAKSRYDAKLVELNRVRNKRGIPSVSSVEQLDDEKLINPISADLTSLQESVEIERALGNTKKVKELEQAIADAQAFRAADIRAPKPYKGISQQGMAGKIPDITKSQPVINEDFTITVKGADNKPIAIGDRPLESVFIVFSDQNFYERGVKSTITNIDYRNQEELIQQVFSLAKDDRKKLQEEFIKLQLLPSNYKATGELDRDGAFENAFLQAHRFANQVNYNRLSNNEPLLGIVDAVKEFKRTSGEGGPQIQKSITEFSLSDGQAEALLEEFYTKALGVRPTKQNVDKFKEIVRERAAKKPRITQTTTTTDGNVSTSSSKVLEEAFGLPEAQLLARRRAETRPEFAGYQMATTFYDAILRAAGPAANVPGPKS